MFRLRMSVEVLSLPLSTSDRSFKLQYATSIEGPWTDVGLIGSTETWRGFDNASIVDGTTLPSLVLSLSDIPESYEEENPSAFNPSAVATREFAEWDWVIQGNNAALNTTYFFRMVESDGTPFGSYTRYPSVVMPPPRTLDQFDYRWFENIDSLDPTTALALPHVPLSATTHGSPYRLRMNVGLDGLVLGAGTIAFKLQYSTSDAGPWTDVGATGSGETWRFFDNPSVTNGTTIGSLLLSNSNVLETYQEANPSVVNPNAVDVNQFGEWDWVIQDNGAADSTSFFFRMVEADGAPLNVYTFFPEIITPSPPVLTQQDYRWFDNINSITPTTPVAGENTIFTGANPLGVLRLRMNVGATVANLSTGGQAFKLQFSTSTGGPFTDVGIVGSPLAWRGFDNVSVADGTTLPSTLLSTSGALESYEEANPSVVNPNGIDVNQRGEWDWVIQSNTSSPGIFFFRMVKDDGTPLNSYVNFPEVATDVPVLTQQDYRWFENLNSVDPVTPLANENALVTGATPLTIFRLRVNVDVSGIGLLAGIQPFKLQYATSVPGGPWTDLGDIDSASAWRGFDNGGGTTDGSTISTLLLTASDVLESYEESNPSVSNPNPIPAGQQGEWDWVIQNNSAPSGTFFIRMVRGDGTPFENYTNFPEITTRGPAYTQRDYRWFGNVDDITPTSPLANENVPFTATSPSLTYRLRMNVEVGEQNLPIAGQSFKLQFSTSTGGVFTDVGAIGSGDAWIGFDNPSIQAQDGATITTLLSTSNSGESYEEENPSVVNPNPIISGDRGEWDWVVRDSGAPSNTTFFFRMVGGNGIPLDSYSRFPEITTAPPILLAQTDYRWFQNRNRLNPVTPIAGENTALTNVTPLSIVRLRMNIGASGANLVANTQAFKLQYATSIPSGPWTDLGDIGSTEAWRGFDNGRPVDGTTISTLLLTSSEVLESYEESNPSVLNPNSISIGQEGEWDWVVQNNVAPSDTFFFRVVKADGNPLETYVNFPEISTASPTFTQQDYRWFENRDSRNPNTALEPENTSFGAGTSGTVYRIRMNVEVGSIILPADALGFKLQFSTTTGGSWTDVGAAGSGAVWRGFDNPGVADGANIATLLSTSNVRESYEEENPSVVNPRAINPGERGEWDWVVENNNATADTTFLFRMVKADGTPLDGFTNFPTITTIPPVIASDDFESGGTAGGTGWSGAWTFVGDVALVTNGKPHQGTFHLRLRRDTGVATREVNLASESSVAIQFWAKAKSFETGETATFSVSPDGSNFTVLNTWVDGVDDDNVYRFFDLSVPVGLLSSTFFIRFESNMSAANDRLWVDEIRVVGE